MVGASKSEPIGFAPESLAEHICWIPSQWP